MWSEYFYLAIYRKIDKAHVNFAAIRSLDETVTQANLAIVVKSLNELAAKKARLEAERNDASGIRFPKELLDQANQFDIESIVSGEEKKSYFSFGSSPDRGKKPNSESASKSWTKRSLVLQGSPDLSEQRLHSSTENQVV